MSCAQVHWGTVTMKKLACCRIADSIDDTQEQVTHTFHTNYQRHQKEKVCQKSRHECKNSIRKQVYCSARGSAV